MFYAFDLRHRYGAVATSFQAWGYRKGAEGQPESLGLLNVDDASVDRGVLKITDQSVLQQVDGIYVTLEPPNGSLLPRDAKFFDVDLGRTSPSS
jgi:hypothetical protein